MKDRVLIICPQENSSFVQHDALILATRFQVEILSLHRLRSPKTFWMLITLVGKLWGGKISAIVMWFSVPHLAPIIVVLGKIFGARILAITGGFDVAFVPVIGWGEMGSPWKRALQRFSLHRVDFILPFSDFSRNDTLRYAPSNIVETLSPGIDCERFTPMGVKSDRVVTTCNIVNRFTIIQKGLDAFASCARSLAEYEFVIIGEINLNDPAAKSFLEAAPRNLTFTQQYVSDDELLSLYRSAKVYVQASAHEGFGIACAEAMACECVPVGTLNTSLPEVIGSAGFLVPYNDIPALIGAIKAAMVSEPLGKAARERIVQNFPPAKRSVGLLRVMNQILNK